ncbi:uncharacterized protein LOC110184603 isoform X2 [Drosophila serrata]|uniref:uncharacterized protein LOC110184603 isoform X2 n=1 Tax=Drosophila serrata TaxID=7274 RepID=UPI000A1D3888|nr:uncharacterized protein LOC110184603 isoform X2 [Drosophila serrata]
MFAKNRRRGMLPAPGTLIRPMIDRSSPAAVRTTEKYLCTGTPNASTSCLLPFPSRLTLAPVSNSPVSCWPKIVIWAKGLGSWVSPRLTAATTSLRFSWRFLKRSRAFKTVRDTLRIPLIWCCSKIRFLTSKYRRMRSSGAIRFPHNSGISAQQRPLFHSGNKKPWSAPSRNPGNHGPWLHNSSSQPGKDFEAVPGLPALAVVARLPPPPALKQTPR